MTPCPVLFLRIDALQLVVWTMGCSAISPPSRQWSAAGSVRAAQAKLSMKLADCRLWHVPGMTFAGLDMHLEQGHWLSAIPMSAQQTPAKWRADSTEGGLRLLDGRSEWPNMRRDLLELGNPLLSPHDKLRLVKRMRGTYTLFSVST